MKSIATWVLFSIAVSCSSTASTAPQFNIVPLGLMDPAHTNNQGEHSSFADQLNDAGQVSGTSERYNGSANSMGHSAWFYDGVTTTRIGLTDEEHTQANGHHESTPFRLNDAGHVSGVTERYNGGAISLGRSAWFFDGATTIRTGLFEIEHVRAGNIRISEPTLMNNSGYLSGYSERYNGGNIPLGRSAWLYNGVNTVKVGLTGSEHTRTGGTKISEAVQLNEAGQVIGHSNRYGGATDLGQSAWLYNGSTTIDIGLTGSAHTSPTGFKFSKTSDLNQAGHVVGFSNREASGTSGYSAWLYNGSTTIDIGLTGPEHSSSGGQKHSKPEEMNEAGQVRGYSVRYNGDQFMGQTAWFYDGTSTIDIGLGSGIYSRNDGLKFSYPRLLNEAGHVGGYSVRFINDTELGYNAWSFDGVATVEIGLSAPEHTRDDGFVRNLPERINTQGQIGGFSNRYNGGADDLGGSAWFYDGATTVDVGLTSPAHTAANGTRLSEINQMNDAGQLTGRAVRYNGGSTVMGEDAWFYDFTLGQTLPLRLSTRSDGYAESFVEYLGDDGVALGAYTLFDSLDNNLGRRAFYFSVADGMHDLGALVDGGLSVNGWNHLANAIQSNGLRQILGRGTLTSKPSQEMAFLLTPLVPEPGTLLLLLTGAIGALFARRK